MSGMIRQPNWLEIEIVQSRSLYANLVASNKDVDKEPLMYNVDNIYLIKEMH